MSLNVPSKQSLCDLINAANGTNYTPDTLGNELPSPLVGMDGFNTSCLVWHVSNPDIKRVVYFNRIDLTEQFGDLLGGYDVTTAQELLDAINEEKTSALALDDFETIDEADLAGDEILLVATVGNLRWIGEVVVVLTEAADPTDPQARTPEPTDEAADDEEEV